MRLPAGAPCSGRPHHSLVACMLPSGPLPQLPAVATPAMRVGGDLNINQPPYHDQDTQQQPFDAAKFDAQRLAADARARTAAAAQAASEAAAEATAPGSREGAWKWGLRKRMWDHMEATDVARPPRPVHHRIPNFQGAQQAAERLAQLPQFAAAQLIKVNPDTPQKMVRHMVLSSGKTLLTPQPRLRTGFFSTLSAASLPSPGSIMEACTPAGAAKWGEPVGLSESSLLKVDMVVVGSTAVSRSGARIGKGEGFAELEYGILRWLGAIDDSTPVVTTVHDCQVVGDDELDMSRMLEHDVPVDFIVTPTQVIATNTRMPKPPGILWHKLSPQKLGQIKVLRELRERIEQDTGQTLPMGAEEVLPPLAERRGGRGKGRDGRRGGRGGRSGGRRMARVEQERSATS